MQASEHVPVLADAVAAAIVPEPGERTIVDATVGAGGHAERMLERTGPGGRLLGLDRDEEALAVARERLRRFGSQVLLVKASFAELGDVVEESGFGPVGGVLWDFGISSMQVDKPERGFSYQHDAPLDMRMDLAQSLDAFGVVNSYSERELTRILREYGEERWAARIAKFIVQARRSSPISTTYQLVDVIRAAIPAAARRGGAHPARRTFQALRIEVNKELEQITSSLPQAVDVTAPGGRLVSLAYHSLEDRIVKRFFATESGGEAPRLRLLARKPIRPPEEEIRANPRASSAKMRIAERLAAPPALSTGPEGSAA